MLIFSLITKAKFSSGADPESSHYTDTLDLLVVIPADPTLLTFIGHWAPPQTTARHFHMYTKLRAAQVKILQDRKPYGVWTLTCPKADFSDTLHCQIVDLHTHSADPDMLSKLSTSVVGQQATNVAQVQPFGIKVLREDDDGWLMPHGKLMWEWVKPQSIYLTSGSWETTLEKAVVNGEWSVGEGMAILVKSVHDENLRSLENSRWKE